MSLGSIGARLFTGGMTKAGQDAARATVTQVADKAATTASKDSLSLSSAAAAQSAAPALQPAIIQHSFSTYCMNAPELERQLTDGMNYLQDSGKIAGFKWNLDTNPTFDRSFYTLKLQADDGAALNQIDSGLIQLLKQQGANGL